jgi:peptidyl-prolyl cis-trans isomerase SurA
MRKFVFWAFLALPLAGGDTVEMIVAKVNGDIVTKIELARTRQQMEVEAAARGAKGPQLQEVLQERSKDLLRDRIDNLLLIQKGKELNINVDGEVSKYLAQIQKQQAIADPEKFQQFIRDNMGMSFEDFKNDVKNGMLTQRVIGQEVYSKVNLPKADLQKYYDDHKAEFIRDERVFLSEIFISTEGKDPIAQAALERKAKDIVARARKGEKFPDLARDNSDSPSKTDAGDIGGFKKGEIDPAIESQVWDKSKGFVTEPIKRTNGWLILRVNDHTREGQATFEEVENQIREKISTPIVMPKIREYLTSLRVDAFLEIREGFIDSGAAPGKDTRWIDPAMLKPATVTKEEVADQKRKKKLLWLVPIPGTTSTTTGKSSSK